MPQKKRSPIIDLPVKIFLTEEGVDFFIKNKKKLNRFRMADDVEAYGISLQQFSPLTIQRMLLVNYINSIEIERAEFMSKRQDVMDLAKLLVYGKLYAMMDNAVFQSLIKSDLIKRWNRMNPGNIIDEKTKVNDTFISQLLAKNPDLVREIKKEILYPIHANISTNSTLLPEEKNIQLFLSEKYLDNLRPLIWLILSRYQGSREYMMLLEDIRVNLCAYMDKSRIAEYLSLMILELVSSTENTNLQGFARNVYKGQVDSKALLFDNALRMRMFGEMEKQDEKLYLNWRMGVKSGSIGMANRLEVTLYNRKTEYQNMKSTIDNQKNVDVKERSLMDFYTELPDSGANTELGLYYLSYLNEAASKVNVKFDSLVNQIRNSDLTVITLRLVF